MAIFQKVQKMLVNFDFLSPNIGFEYHGSNKYKTIQGALYSLIILIAAAVIAGLFSQDFISIQNPSVLASQELIEESNVSISNYPIMYSFVENNTIVSGNLLKFFDVDVVFFEVFSNFTMTRRIKTKNVLKTCDTKDYIFVNDMFKEQFISLTNSTGIYCLNPEGLYFRNPYGVLNSAFINVRFQKCDKTKRECPSSLDTLVESMYIGLVIFDSYIDSKNYTNPIKYKSITHNVGIVGTLLKRFYYQIRSDSYSTDYGRLMEDTYVEKIFSYRQGNSDIFLNTDSKGDKYNHVYWSTFESPLIRSTYFRSYMKIQDFIANVGGFANMVFIFIQVLFSHHLRFLYLLFLRDQALCDNNQTPSIIEKSK